MSAGLSFTNQRGFSDDSWFNMIIIIKTCANHLWTCIPEMKYYLFIRLLTFIVYKTQRIWKKYHGMCGRNESGVSPGIHESFLLTNSLARD